MNGWLLGPWLMAVAERSLCSKALQRNSCNSQALWSSLLSNLHSPSTQIDRSRQERDVLDQLHAAASAMQRSNSLWGRRQPFAACTRNRSNERPPSSQWVEKVARSRLKAWEWWKSRTLLQICLV